MVKRIPGSIRTVHRLNFAEKLKVVKWLEDNKEALHKERPTFAETAIVCQEALQLSVDADMIRNITRDAGLRWDPKRACRNPDGSGPTWAAIRELQANVINLEQELNNVKEELERVRQEVRS